jgi:hypothetical protein
MYTSEDWRRCRASIEVSSPSRSDDANSEPKNRTVVGRVPVLDDLQALVDLPAQCRLGEVASDEDRARRSAELDERGVGRVLGPGREKRRKICSDSAVPSRRAVAT